MKRIKKYIHQWWRGVPYKNNPDSNILVLGHNRHWTSLLVRRILKYIKHEYRWIVGIILAILGVVHGLF